MGWLLIVLGPLISLGMVALTMFLAPIVNASTPPGSLPRYTGSHQMTVAAFTLFGLLFVFGLVGLATAFIKPVTRANPGRWSCCSFSYSQPSSRRAAWWQARPDTGRRRHKPSLHPNPLAPAHP